MRPDFGVAARMELIMEKRKFPKLNIETSLLGFGCMRFPRTLGVTNIKETESQILAAIKGGINYFDTAYVYHAGESEIFAGKILNKYPRESYNLATKLPGWAIKNDGKTVDELFNEQLEKCDVE